MKITKMTRRSLAVLLVMMMVFSLAVPAFADTGIADDTAVIAEDHTHDNEAAGETANENGDATDTDDVDAEEHVHSYIAAVDGTCEGPADITYICDCGDEYAEHIDLLEHDEEVIDALEATCTTGGYTIYQCNYCGRTQTRDVVEALGHDYDAVVTEPTCTMQGYTTYTCSRCDDSYVGDYTDDANAHVWDAGIQTKESTCTEAGIMLFTCTVCDAISEEAIPMIEHDYVDNFDVDGMQLPTCTENGCAQSVCSVCGYVENSRIIEALGHDGVAGDVTAPTCTMQGYTAYTCTRCGESYQDDYTDMIPHVRDEEVPGDVLTPAQIGAAGIIEYTCSECGMPFTAAIPALSAPSAGGGGGGGGAAAPEPAPVEIVDPEVPLADVLPFDDVNANSWFLEAVKYVYDKDLMGGTDNNTFAPNAGTTRGMIVTILHRMENKPEVTTAAGFSDIAAGKWYSDAVSWAAENEIVKGYEDGSFRPDNSITRQELAAILYRYAEYKQYDVTGRTELSAYADAAAVSAFAKDAVEWAVSEELIGGLTDGTLAPANGATRAQLATILMRFNQNFDSESETK